MIYILYWVYTSWFVFIHLDFFNFKFVLKTHNMITMDELMGLLAYLLEMNFYANLVGNYVKPIPNNV